MGGMSLELLNESGDNVTKTQAVMILKEIMNSAKIAGNTIEIAAITQRQKDAIKRKELQSRSHCCHGRIRSNKHQLSNV